MASTITPSSAPWRSSPLKTPHSNRCSAAVARVNTRYRRSRRRATEPAPLSTASSLSQRSISSTSSEGSSAGGASSLLSADQPTPMRPWRGRPVSTPTATTASSGVNDRSSSASSAVFSPRRDVPATCSDNAASSTNRIADRLGNDLVGSRLTSLLGRSRRYRMARRGRQRRRPETMTDTVPAATAAATRAGDARVLDRVVVRFAGDSGDGMQLTGDRFTSVSALYGNDLSTLPEFPAEIRAPAGTVHGVSSFQVHISDHPITTPGDEPNVLVAMNPAALRADLGRLEVGGTLIVNEDAFEERNLLKAGYHRADGTATQPARRRQPRHLPRHQGADDQPHQGGDAAARRQTAGRRALEELLRPRPRLVDVHPSDRTDARLDRAPLRWQRARRRSQPGGVPRRLQLRRDHRGRRSPLRGAPGPPARRASTRASRATRRSRGASSPAGSSPSSR